MNNRWHCRRALIRAGLGAAGRPSGGGHVRKPDAVWRCRMTGITVAETVAAGSFTPPGGQPIRNLPSFCRVAGVIRPVEDSSITFEVWIPSSGWNGKF